MLKRKSQAESFLSERLDIERELTAAGQTCICGADEAGRGPLAGPVVAAAVVFKDCNLLWAARDSKALSAKARADYYFEASREFEYGIGICTAEEIDSLNILQASLLAMVRAIQALPQRPTIALVDGNRRPLIDIPCRAIVRGDARVAVIGAASILAKFTRDRIMDEYDALYPGYDFARHFGYPTAEHRKRLKNLGPCPIHRRTFHGVREFFQDLSA
jgi:ribonuclease HII